MELTQYQSLKKGGLARNHFAYRLWEKAKKLGIWNPAEIDMVQDRADWLGLSEAEKYTILTLTAHFLAGEEAVTVDILPLIKVMATQGHLEEEMYLTSFLWEEAKHVDFFARITQEVIGTEQDLHAFHGPNYQKVFYKELPRAMNRLYIDDSPEAIAEASVTYNMVVEGVLAETGYHVWYTMLKKNNLMPGIVEGIQLLQRDESRHISYAVHLLSRLIAENGASLWFLIQKRMGELLEPAIGIIEDLFVDVETQHGTMPFGLTRDDFVSFALSQFQKRFNRLEKALDTPLESILFVHE